jgi:hypothetical protein
MVSVAYIPHLLSLPSVHKWGSISRSNLIKMVGLLAIIIIFIVKVKSHDELTIIPLLITIMKDGHHYVIYMKNDNN